MGRPGRNNISLPGIAVAMCFLVSDRKSRLGSFTHPVSQLLLAWDAGPGGPGKN